VSTFDRDENHYDFNIRYAFESVWLFVLSSRNSMWKEERSMILINAQRLTWMRGDGRSERMSANENKIKIKNKNMCWLSCETIERPNGRTQSERMAMQ
jgi:hypothetical protein